MAVTTMTVALASSCSQEPTRRLEPWSTATAASDDRAVVVTFPVAACEVPGRLEVDEGSRDVEIALFFDDAGPDECSASGGRSHDAVDERQVVWLEEPLGERRISNAGCSLKSNEHASPCDSSAEGVTLR